MYYDGFGILRGFIYTGVLSLFAHEAIYILLRSFHCLLLLVVPMGTEPLSGICSDCGRQKILFAVENKTEPYIGCYE